MFQRKLNKFVFRILGAFGVLMLLSACNLPEPVASVPQTETAKDSPVPTLTLAVPNSTPTQLQEDVIGQETAVAVDVSGVAQDFILEEIPAVPTSDGLLWLVMPQYRRLTLSGYPISNHLMEPQIFIYPVDELKSINEGAGKIVSDLQVLLQDQQAGDYLPFLPLFNAGQVMHAQMKFLDFKNGKGVRYLTQFDQAFLPINNYELIYTYQGLTSDGMFYVAAVLPVSLPGLPADEKVNGQEPPEFRNDFLTYLDNTVNMLNEQPAGEFTPDLSKLDAVIETIEIK